MVLIRVRICGTNCCTKDTICGRSLHGFLLWIPSGISIRKIPPREHRFLTQFWGILWVFFQMQHGLERVFFRCFSKEFSMGKNYWKNVYKMSALQKKCHQKYVCRMPKSVLYPTQFFTFLINDLTTPRPGCFVWPAINIYFIDLNTSRLTQLLSTAWRAHDKYLPSLWFGLIYPSLSQFYIE